MAPEIQIDDEVWAVLKSHAEPFIDTPNSVLRRLLDMAASANGASSAPGAFVGEKSRPHSPGRRTRQRRPRKRQADGARAQPGTILGDEEYDLPILAILDEHDGRAPTREVLDELGERLADSLMPADYEALASGDIRWRNRAQFVRLRLIQRGDMKKNSPRGLWEISDQGRDRLVGE